MRQGLWPPGGTAVVRLLSLSNGQYWHEYSSSASSYLSCWNTLVESCKCISQCVCVCKVRLLTRDVYFYSKPSPPPISDLSSRLLARSILVGEQTTQGHGVSYQDLSLDILPREVMDSPKTWILVIWLPKKRQLEEMSRMSCGKSTSLP
jgi:hypothetical protein